MQTQLQNVLYIFISLLVIEASLSPSHSQTTIDELLPNKEQLSIPINKSVIVKLTTPAERVSVVAAEIADVQIIEPTQIMVSALSVGETSLIIWTESGEIRTIDLKVKWNTSAIKETINTILPDEAIDVVSLDNGVALTGKVRNIESVPQAMDITQSYSPQVVNLLEMPGVHQVLLKVKIAEVASNFRHEKGFNFLINNGSVSGGNVMSDLISGDLSGGNVSMTEAVTMFFSISNGDVSSFIQALEERGWFHIHAQPNLIARSGETASFLAGGEYPIPVVQSGLNSNAITIEYKEFGVKLQFTPTILSEKTVQLDIEPEVSDLDFSNGVQISGFTIPTLLTRRVHTVVRLNEGQTFAIAGLLNRTGQNTKRKVPGVGDIPLLGHLFRGKEISEQQTELLVMVTPHLIAPLDENEKTILPEPLEFENLQLHKQNQKHSKVPSTKQQTINNIKNDKSVNNDHFNTYAASRERMKRRMKW